MKEELLHVVWKLKRFEHDELRTVEGCKLEIVKYGQHNANQGPDFLNGEVIINNTRWLGHIEIHIKASEWYKHKHHTDPQYDNVILHVVYEYDSAVHNTKDQTIPTLTLKKRISPTLLNSFKQKFNSLTWIPCADSLYNKNFPFINIYYERLLIERLLAKTSRLNKLLKTNKNDWDQLSYQLIIKYLGMSVNQNAFLQLTEALPFKIIKNQSAIFAIEALIFGQAGLLNRARDQYLKALRKEYQYLRKKYNLQPMSGLEWKFSRMRPGNFPTIRMAQLAQICLKNPRLFNQIINSKRIQDLREIFQVDTSGYWQTHYIPGKKSKFIVKKIGASAQNNIIINAIIPIIFAYGKMTQQDKYIEIAINYYAELPAEKNVITKQWKKHGFSINCAGNSQALIELKNNYCDKQRCLDCQVGKHLLFNQ